MRVAEVAPRRCGALLEAAALAATRSRRTAWGRTITMTVVLILIVRSRRTS